jgi:outer membrane immunogenic protein
MQSRSRVGGLVLAAVSVLSIGAAEAADLPAPPAPVAYAPPVYNWTGIYVGAHLGGGFSHSSWTDAFTGANDTFNKWGFLGGAQVGANYQFNRLVAGIEGDFSWTGLKGAGLDSIGDSIGTKVNFTSAVTGRIGAAFDRLLVYGKGGVAFANDQSSLTDLAGNNASTTFIRTGWTVGVGAEYALDDNWSARLEYDYLGFGSQALSFSTPLLPAYTSSANLNVQEVKAGINFRFGP